MRLTAPLRITCSLTDRSYVWAAVGDDGEMFTAPAYIWAGHFRLAEGGGAVCSCCVGTTTKPIKALMEINENDSLRCDLCGHRIESAYGG